MRKASQDGGDSTSITSGIESETKKPGAGILKSTKNSIKRKVQHFSDDTANEPLLHKNKEISEIEKQSAKLLLTKTKTDFGCQKGDDKDKLLADDKIAKPSISDVTKITHHCGLTGISNGLKEQKYSNSQSISTASIHNHMYTNVFGNMEGLKNSVVAKTQILVELDTSKSTGYSPSPLIFTTAKIHTDGKMQQMEPVQVTPVPILSTIEGDIAKTETKSKESSEKPKSGEFIKINNTNISEQQAKEKKNITLTPKPVASMSKLYEKHEFNTTSTQNIVASACNKPAQNASNLISDNKDKDTSTLEHYVLNVSSIQTTTSQLSNISKKSKNEILSTKISQLSQESNDSAESKLSYCTVKPTKSTISSKNLPIMNKTDIAHMISCSSSSPDKNYVDINKNIQTGSHYEPEEKQIGYNTADLKAVASKPIIDINKIKEFGIGSSVKEELSKVNSSPITSTKTSKQDSQDEKKTNIKPHSHEEAEYNINCLSSEKSVIISTAMANNADEVIESGSSKASSPSTSYSSTNKKYEIDKTSSTSSSKTISTEISPLINLQSKKVSNEKSDIIKTGLTGTTSKIPQTAITSSTLSEMKCATNNSKILSTSPMLNFTNTKEGRVNTEIMSSDSGLANNQSATLNTALKSKTTENSAIKTSTAATPNNVATVVSSISKPTTTASGIKLPSSITPFTGAVKPVPKQSVSVKTVPSGVQTVSSSVKSSTANVDISDKIDVTSRSANKSKSNIIKPINSTSKVSTTDNIGVTSSALSSTSKLPSPCSTKTAARNVSQNQAKVSGTVLDVKVSKA
ncbi:hypothetical protein MSG28_001573 [Choristoneura fumiferana]|uniref:Uncharacterized protein n=1 Tax=Choristoneura fumiferana TaxID=7141 RepID=A0ACC0KV52_CHOFU|nr:hypothetical protein MSG28_001573 [Choristoneura fumiferana]